MNERFLKAINTLTIPAILFIGVLFYLFNLSLLWLGVCLIILLLLLVFYINIRKPISEYIDARRKAKNKPVDVKGERFLKAINTLTIPVIVFIGVLFYIYILSQLWLGISLIILILLLVGFINIKKLITDIA